MIKGGDVDSVLTFLGFELLDRFQFTYPLSLWPPRQLKVAMPVRVSAYTSFMRKGCLTNTTKAQTQQGRQALDLDLWREQQNKKSHKRFKCGFPQLKMTKN